jgi:hypothetical protein
LKILTCLIAAFQPMRENSHFREDVQLFYLNSLPSYCCPINRSQRKISDWNYQFF